MADLKSCPFCGGEAEVVKIHSGVAMFPYTVVCKSDDCSASVGVFKETREKAIEAWNTRKPMEDAVAELENVSFERFGNDGMGGQKVLSLDDAISIVREKERKYCGNCKHQPEPLTTCEWLKSQTQIIKECPRWEGKE